jgi:hypothetical protein
MNKFQVVLDVKPTAKEERQQLQESCDHKFVHDSGHWFMCTKCTYRVKLDSTLSQVRNKRIWLLITFYGLLQIFQLFCLICFFNKHFVNYIFIFTVLTCISLLILRKFYEKEFKKLSLLELIANICIISIGCSGLLRLISIL